MWNFFKYMAGGIFGGSVFLAFCFMFTAITINILYFPNCNRINRDCFMVEKLWPVIESATQSEIDSLTEENSATQSAVQSPEPTAAQKYAPALLASMRGENDF